MTKIQLEGRKMAEITLDLEHLPGYLDDIAQKQLPFACAHALTHIAIKAADQAVKLANMRFNVVHRTYLQNATHAKIGQKPSLARAVHAMPADYKKPIDEQKSIVGVTHWGIAELMGEHMTERRTLGKAKYRWVPLKGRKLGYGVKQAYPGQGSKSKGNFFIKSKRGKHLLVTRAGKSRKITPMFLRKKVQDIRPIFNLNKLADNVFKLNITKQLEDSMDFALRTAKQK